MKLFTIYALALASISTAAPNIQHFSNETADCLVGGGTGCGDSGVKCCQGLQCLAGMCYTNGTLHERVSNINFGFWKTATRTEAD
ncbi:hypothetical protein F5B20DRAFT_583857 [Whalleya microplaca]|nr:hypothetical protein F5B20DRAFT_583857 [Whalleya microplaca]